MLLLDSEALSALAQGPPVRRDSVRTLIAALRERGEVPETVAAVLAEVVRGRRQDAGVFAGMRRERLRVLPVDTRLAVRAGELLGWRAVRDLHAMCADSWRWQRMNPNGFEAAPSAEAPR